MGDTPTSPARAKPLRPIAGFRRTDVFARGRFWLVRIYVQMEQVLLYLNIYSPLGNTCRT